MPYCSACGESVPENAAFCPKCGSPVTRPSGAVNEPSAPASAPGSGGVSGLAIPENVAGMLCYIFLAAVIFLLVQPYNRNRFIRFHAFQSILLTVVWIVLHGVVIIPWIGWALWPTMELAFLIAWVVLLIKAYQGVMFKLPVIGDFAQQQAG